MFRIQSIPATDNSPAAAVPRLALSQNQGGPGRTPALAPRPSQSARPLAQAIAGWSRTPFWGAVVFRLVVREHPCQVLPERLKLRLEAAAAHLKHHQQPGDHIVRMDEESGSNADGRAVPCTSTE